MAERADGERRRGRAGERRRAEDADVEAAEAERQQIGRQQDGDIAVRESAQGTGDEQTQRLRVGAGRKERMRQGLRA